MNRQVIELNSSALRDTLGIAFYVTKELAMGYPSIAKKLFSLTCDVIALTW